MAVQSTPASGPVIGETPGAVLGGAGWVLPAAGGDAVREGLAGGGTEVGRPVHGGVVATLHHDGQVTAGADPRRSGTAGAIH